MASGAHDAVVIGGGHNGLVTAAYLARAGLGTLVLERRASVGGAAATSELARGFRVPTLAHTVGRLRASVVRDLGLRERGLAFLAPDVRVFAPQPDGTAITLWADVARTADGLRGRSPHDADAYANFDRLVRSLARFVGDLAATTPPDIRSPSLGDALTGLRLGRSFRGLGKHDARTLLRVLPMAVADFAGEAFEDDALRAVVAARGIQYTAMGPWSAGTTGVLLADSVGPEGGAAGQAVFAKGGPGAMSDALAAAVRAFGGEIRTNADVVAITARDGRANGVALAPARRSGRGSSFRGWTRRERSHSWSTPWSSAPPSAGAWPTTEPLARSRRSTLRSPRCRGSRRRGRTPVSCCAGGSSSRPAWTTWSAPSTTPSTVECRRSPTSKPRSHHWRTHSSPRGRRRVATS